LAQSLKKDYAYHSFHAGRIVPFVNPDTITDGMPSSLGSLAFPMVKYYANDIGTVAEEVIIHVVRTIRESYNK